MAKYGRAGRWDVGEPAIMRLPPHKHLNPCPCPFCNPREMSRRKARLILHHGEVRDYPLTEPQRRFFGARASGYPRRNPVYKVIGGYSSGRTIERKYKTKASAKRAIKTLRRQHPGVGAWWTVKVHKENPMARRGYGADVLPAHYRRRSRRRSLPPMAGHKIVRGHYRHNPGRGGGTNWLPIIAIGAGVFLLMRPGGLGGMFGGAGTSVLPAGYTYLGSGYYRSPTGQTMYRSPTTGQMTPVTAQQAVTGQLTQAGVQAGGQIITQAMPQIIQAGASIFGSLATGIAGLFQQDQAPLVSDTYTGGSTGYADVLRSGYDVGYVPPPLPPMESIYQEVAFPEYQMSLELAPAPVSINGTDQAGWW